MEVLLRLAGLICLGLVVANFVALCRPGYARSLAGAETLVLLRLYFSQPLF